MSEKVSLFVNCFERDYRQVLAADFMRRKAAQFKFPFSKRIVTINNVDDKQAALKMARAAVERGEIVGFIEVDKELPRALKACGISPWQLGRVRHYIDFALVSVVAASPGYLLYCCAEVDLTEGFNWVSPALKKFKEDSAYLVANPCWESDPEGAERESLRRDGAYWVGEGFSDQCFLVDAEKLAAPIYGFTHPAGARYPMSDIGDIFEKRVDAYMRLHGFLRLSDSRAFYRHHGAEGLGYPKASLLTRIKRRMQRIIKRSQPNTSGGKSEKKEEVLH